MTVKPEILVIGGGSWGTAFANYLCSVNPRIHIWMKEPELAEAMVDSRENPMFLPGIRLESNLIPVSDLQKATAAADTLVFAVPSKFSRNLFADIRPVLQPRQMIVNLSKGFEAKTLMTISEIAADVLGEAIYKRWVTLSGPSFARELAQKHPTAVVAASRNPEALATVQTRFSSGTLRIYSSDDLTGIEVGGSVKNVMAIAAGMVKGLGFGYNTTATLVSRASIEISRLGQKKGGRFETILGLAGIGDLMLTCFGELSRNHQLGRRLAQGESLSQIEASTPMVAEGVETTRAVWKMAERFQIDMPICQEVYRVLFEGKPPRSALADLMNRSLKAEWSTN